MMHLQGRVFTRLNQFNALPMALQHEANSLADHLAAQSGEVFAKHHALNLKTVYGVRAKHLLHVIDEWIARHHGGHITGSTEAPHSSSFPVAVTGGPAPTAIPVASAGGHQPHPHGHNTHGHTTTTTTTHGKHSSPTHHVASSHAQTLLQALVLKGFIAPHKEDKHVAPSTTEDLSFKDNDLFVPLAKHVQVDPNAPISVWDLVDGAVFAGSLKRKAGPLEPLTHGKDVYAVVNARYKTLTLFKTDVSRKPIAQLEATGMQVAFESTRYDHGVKVWTTLHKELLNAGSQPESDALVHALLAVGAQHDKRHFLDDHLTPSELHNPNARADLRQHQHQDKSGSLTHRLGNMFHKKDDTPATAPAYAAP